MGRRGQRANAQCTYPGCREWGYFEYDTMRAYADDHDRRAKWRCVRHTAPDEVLSLATPERSARLVCVESQGSRFWQQDGGRIGSGFRYGPGFQAHAEDFAPGTVLVITARIEAAAPGGQTGGQDPDAGHQNPEEQG